MIKKFALVSLLIICADALVLINDPHYCYSWDPIRPQLEMTGPTTEYDKVRDHNIETNVSKCKPSRFWYQGRHGSRYPSSSDNDNLFNATNTINKQITQNFFSLKTTLCLPDADLLKNWNLNPNFTLATSGALTQSGWTELKKIATRYQKAFPTLLPKHYSRQHYYFRHSPVPRTLTSAQAFADGLFGPNEYNDVNYEGGEPTDRFLYPFGNCPVFYSFYANMPEVKAFTETPYYQQMVQQVSKKLGFHGDQQLSADIISKCMTHCRYEQILNHEKSSPFCTAFSIANHQVNEYYSDLLYYSLFGYGNPTYRKLYENMSCYLLQAMLQFLQSNDPNEQKAKFWFGHDVNLAFMYVALGLFEDKVPLTGSNFAQQTNRKWKTSFLTPMAGNMAVIRFE